MKLLYVYGYVLRFCEDCSRCTEQTCTNYKSSIYYISESDAHKIHLSNIPLVIAHNNLYEVGKIVDYKLTGQGILVTAVIDDYYLLKSLKEQHKNYPLASVGLLDYCKKVFTSFSLAHDTVSFKVPHVSLVNIPGRLGTSISYSEKYGRPVVRSQNIRISNVVAAQCVTFLTKPGRNKYQIINLSKSASPSDDNFLYASIMPNNSLFDEWQEFKRFSEMRKTDSSAKDEDDDRSTFEKNLKRTNAGLEITPKKENTATATMKTKCKEKLTKKWLKNSIKFMRP